MNVKTEVKERPIIFSTEMVKAILDGRKTQTRRVVKPCSTATIVRGGQEVSPEWVYKLAKCPYGQVGDRLWGREAFWIQHDWEWDEYLGKVIDHGINIAEDTWAEVRYCATDTEPRESDPPLSVYSKRPSIHMPRWASRLTLEITEVRVERLQEINFQGARAEGIIVARDHVQGGLGLPMRYESTTAFSDLWDSLNAKRGYGWEINPWVWKISFNLWYPIDKKGG